MAANPEGPMELAMTHYGDHRGAYRRPSEVRESANRVLGWRDAPATCQSCIASRAVYLINAAVALCPLCRDERRRRAGEGVELLRRSVPASIGRVVIGPAFYGRSIAFDSLSVDLGGFKEIIASQAVNRSLKENADLLGLWNHNSDLPMGRISAGNMSAEKRADGLYMRLAPLTTDAPYLEKVEQGIVRGQSFGFRMIEDEWNYDGVIPVRTVLDMRVSELSVVVFPAYGATTVTAQRNTRDPRWLRMQLAR